MSLSKKANSSTVLIAAVVALVALVGLVTGLNQGHSQGMQVIKLPSAQDTLTYKDAVTQSKWQYYDSSAELGQQIAEACSTAKNPDPLVGNEVTECCNKNCAAACNNPLDDTCSEHCDVTCRSAAAMIHSPYINY